jgi:hypothetical protein
VTIFHKRITLVHVGRRSTARLFPIGETPSPFIDVFGYLHVALFSVGNYVIANCVAGLPLDQDHPLDADDL